jgi:hypothetical protein
MSIPAAMGVYSIAAQTLAATAARSHEIEL